VTSESQELEADASGPRVFKVAEVNRAVKRLLARKCTDLLIEGEVGGLTLARSGHLYFTLNDEREAAQLKCVMFRGDVRKAHAQITEGARLRLRGDLSLFESRGVFQMIARDAVPMGEGELRARFEKIRNTLEAEGLLDFDRKRPLPRMPRVVGVVTSEAGAALRDVIRVAHHRCPTRLVVADCRVQGDAAPQSIVDAIEAIQRLPDLEIVIVTRGGGSAEDLWAFNEEAVARAIAACRVPTVVGIGHETDITIAELVADARAATPSNAAELVIPEEASLVAELDGLRRRLDRAMETRIDQGRLRLERLSRGVLDPRHHVSRSRGRLEALNARAQGALDERLARERRRIARLVERLRAQDARARLVKTRRRLDELASRLRVVGPELTQTRRLELARAGAKLDSLSPLRVLERGYAIALHEPTGRALRSASDAEVGDALTLRLAKGTVRAEVRELHGAEGSNDT